jgi:hypothetical protein
MLWLISDFDLGPEADITAVSRHLDACWQKMNADRWVPTAHGQQRNAL